MSGRRRWRIAQKAERRWWRRYLKGKPPEDYLETKAGQWRRELELIADVITVPDGACLLDAGCGPAGIFMMFPECAVDAVDPLLYEYETDLAHFSRKTYPWVTFYPVPFEQFDPPAAYDFVFCNNAVNHFSDLELSLDRLLEALAPHGRLILSSDTHNHALFRYLFRAIPFDVLHPHQYLAAEYEKMLTDRGATIEKRVVVEQHYFFDRWLWVVSRDD
jgi:2-polyprenyl-6-hydroxyphenyl methylase/3-demethylubiquinone-9 3-methyltransferase